MSSHRFRQYAGLALILVAYMGGMIGWTWAVQTVDSEGASASDGTPLRDSLDHGRFDQVLTQYVNDEGLVDYAALSTHADSVLDPYLRALAATNPSTLDRDARLAFWINAYNALTLKLIADKYPVQNIWAVTPGPAKPKDNSPFALDVGVVADTVRTLDEIEHQIIRQRFDEPRIHFALVCAAKSCPRLRRAAYTGPHLNAQLEAQAQRFFHDRDKNRIPSGRGEITLSRILKWYGGDFGESKVDLQRFIASYFEGSVQDRLSSGAFDVSFLPYDWALNDQRKSAASVGESKDAR